MKKFLIFLALFSFVGCWEAVIIEDDFDSTKFKIFGTVISATDNQPLQNATIWLSLETPQFDRVIDYSVSDPAGNFYLYFSFSDNFYLHNYKNYLYLNISKSGYDFYKVKLSDIVNLEIVSGETLVDKDFLLNKALVDTIPPFVVLCDISNNLRFADSLQIFVLFSEEVIFNENYQGVKVFLHRDKNPCDTTDKSKIFSLFPNPLYNNFNIRYENNKLYINHPAYDNVTCLFKYYNVEVNYQKQAFWKLFSFSLDTVITDIYKNPLKKFSR